MRTDRPGGGRVRGLLGAAAVVVLVLVALAGAGNGTRVDHPSLRSLVLTDPQVPREFLSGDQQSTALRVAGYPGLLHQWTERDQGETVGLLRVLVVDGGLPDYAAHGMQAAVADLIGRGLRPVSVPGTPGTVWLVTANRAGSSAAGLFTRGEIMFEVAIEQPPSMGLQRTLQLTAELTSREQNRAATHYTGATSAVRLSRGQAAGTALGVPLVYLWLVDAWAFLRDPLRRRRRRGSTRTAPPQTQWTMSVDRQAKRQKRLARALTYAELAGASLIVDALLPMSWPARAALAVAGLLVVLTTARLRSFYVGRSASSSTIHGQRPVRATLLSTSATLMALFAALVTFAYVIDANQSPGQNSFLWSAVASLAAAGLLQRRARRISAMSARALLGRDPRPMVLYLRSFDDDRLRLRTATLGRRTLLERLSPNRFDSYEEVLVRHLSALGPVVAINAPGTSLAPIGAARESLPGESWQSVVGEWMDRARLIVISTPPGTLTPGLEWELSQLSHHDRWARTLVVTPPVTDEEMRRRWNVLAAASPHEWPLRQLPPADMADVLVLARGGGMWTAFSASRRTEWSYAAALRAATGRDRGREPATIDHGGRSATEYPARVAWPAHPS